MFPLALAQRAPLRNVTRCQWRHAASKRSYSTPNQPEAKPRSAHAEWYAEMLPAMVPVALLGSAVYLGLRFTQSYLANERFVDESRAKVEELEREVEMLRAQRDAAAAAPTTPAAEVDGKKSGWLW